MGVETYTNSMFFSLMISLSQTLQLLKEVSIEEGSSNRIAVFNKSCNVLNVYKFFDDNDAFCQTINLDYIGSMNPGRLTMANFLMGKIMFILKSERQFQCIIVTEEGEIIEGNKQEFQLSRVKDVTFNEYGIFVRSYSAEKRSILFFK